MKSSLSAAVRPMACLTACVLYTGLAAAAVFFEIPVTMREPAPEGPAVIHFVFQMPAAVADNPTAVSPAAPPSAEPATMTEPQAPPRPPPQARTAIKLSAPSPAVAAPAAPSPSAPADQQLAALSPASMAAVVLPRPIDAAGNAKPIYPAEAQRRGLQGRVILRVEVSDAGTPVAVDVRASSGHAILDRAALHAVEAWRFIPATRGGVPVAGAVDVPVQFRLED